MEKAGQPPKYSDPVELEEKIKQYFDSITVVDTFKVKVKGFDPDRGKPYTYMEEKLNKQGEPIEVEMYVKPPTVEGMAHYLGIHRDTLHHMETQRCQEFSDIIRRAKQRIKMYLMENCSKKDKPMGDIFVLECGFGMKRQKDEDQYQLAKEKLEIEKIKADKGINDDDKNITINLITNGDKNDKQRD